MFGEQTERALAPSDPVFGISSHIFVGNMLTQQMDGNVLLRELIVRLTVVRITTAVHL